jgi:F-type H+-transporting ATPase subunit b
MTNYLFLLALQSVTTESEGGLFDFNATLPAIALEVILLMWILDSIFYKPIGNNIQNRHDYINSQLKQASDMLTKADQLTNRYESELARHKKAAQSTIMTAKKEAEDTVNGRLKTTRGRAETIITSAIKDLQRQKQKVQTVLEKQVDWFSQRIKGKLLPEQELLQKKFIMNEESGISEVNKKSSVLE